MSLTTSGGSILNTLPISTSLLALALATSAAAQSAPGPATVPAKSNLDEVVVTATRLPTERLKIADSITIITAGDIALKQQQTLTDVLAAAPGLNVVQAGGPGGQASLFMRGANSNHVKVFVDGIDLSDPSSPTDAFDFGQFLTPDIERVEILRGPQSGLYGSDAVGGVINIITRSGNGPPDLALDLEGGAFDTFNQSAVLSGSTGPFHYVATVQHFHSGATPVTPLDLLAPGEPRNDDADDNLTATTKLGYDVSAAFDLGLVARYTETHLRFTGDDYLLFTPDGDEAPDPVQSRTDHQQVYARAKAHLSLLDGQFDQTLGVGYSNLRTVGVSPYQLDPVAYSRSPFYGNRLKVDWQGDVKLTDRDTLLLGVEDQRDAISRPISAGSSIASGYAELQMNPVKDLNATVAVRYDANSRFGGATTYRFAPTYFIEATGTKLEASVGTGFKAPSLTEMFESFPAYGFYANPDLRPERSLGFDVGFEQYLVSRRVQFGATYFDNHITNLIDTVYIDAGAGPCPLSATFGCEQEGNVGKVHTDGIESFVLVQPTDAVSVRLDYTYTEAKDEILRETLLRRPRNKWSLDGRWQATSKLSLDAELLIVRDFVDGNRSFSIPRLNMPGFTTLDLAANYDLSRRLTLYGRITNLADERDQDPDGFLRPGRGIFIGLKARL